MESDFEEIRRLRRGMRDLAAISALPTVWVNYDRLRVADSLAGALVQMLELRLVYVRVGGPSGSDLEEVVHTAQGAAPTERARDVRERLSPWINARSPMAECVPSPLGEGALRLTVVPLGSCGRIRRAGRGVRSARFPDRGGTSLDRRGGKPGRGRR